MSVWLDLEGNTLTPCVLCTKLKKKAGVFFQMKKIRRSCENNNETKKIPCNNATKRSEEF